MRMFVLNVLESPSCHSQLQAEIDELGKTIPAGQSPTYTQIASLPFLAACIRETMRHDPPVVSYLPRLVNTGGIELFGKFVPDGVEVACSPYVISRDPGLYGNDADAFRPERFLDDPKWAEQVARYEFHFGYGPRRCVGKLLSQVVLAKALFQA